MQLQYLMTNLKVLSDMFLSDSIRMNISKAEEMAKFDRNIKENLGKVLLRVCHKTSLVVYIL